MKCILLAGAKGDTARSLFEAEIAAVNLVFQFCTEIVGILPRLYYDCPGVIHLLKNFNACVAWHVKDEYHRMKQYLSDFPNTSLETIAREDNVIVDAFASFGRHNPQLTLFFQGLDRPTWLEDFCARKNFCFNPCFVFFFFFL